MEDLRFVRIWRKIAGPLEPGVVAFPNFLYRTKEIHHRTRIFNLYVVTLCYQA